MSSPPDLASPRTLLNRRTVLAGTAGAAALADVHPGAAFGGAGAVPISDPFTLGVAPGDPMPVGMVLWTRASCVVPEREPGLSPA
ncbi:hypothetical protein [Pseudonocardia sp.]|uniref:hypothetical protein n=1 Tax=Pseudonocardia sp. TaxID=60912 RepID=UPI0026115F28|nr:hypothetical protein [Pseudonocardia sp.]